MLLALKMGEEATSQKNGQPLKAGRGKETNSVLQLTEGSSLVDILSSV